MICTGSASGGTLRVSAWRSWSPGGLGGEGVRKGPGPAVVAGPGLGGTGGSALVLGVVGHVAVYRSGVVDVEVLLAGAAVHPDLLGHGGFLSGGWGGG